MADEQAAPTSQQKAETWARVKEEKEEVDRKRLEIENTQNRLATSLDSLSKDLRTGVGATVPTKVYTTKQGLVVVTVERGVMLVQPERP